MPDPTSKKEDVSVAAPVERIPTDPAEDKLEDGIALCLSGGGYRAMLFHLGSLWRLNQLGLLSKLERISSVSGGSITAGVLGLNWGRLGFVNGVAGEYESQVVAPVRKLASRSIDWTSITGGVLLPGSISDKVAGAYRKYLFGEATLQQLPDRPRFVINATNVQSKALWRFSKPYMRDWRVGEVKNPQVKLATAVAASSAFPPFLSPLELDLEEDDYTPNSGADLQRPPFTTQVVLTDGGVYDNLGLETAWKRYGTILVSDGGGVYDAEADPKRDWAHHMYRVFNLIDNQVRSLRKRQVIGSFDSGQRQGAYWSTWSDIADYPLGDALPCPAAKTAELAATPTRLKALEPRLQERLINWGYAVCDAAMRSFGGVEGAPPPEFPYDGGVG
jgi:NTE family protein